MTHTRVVRDIRWGGGTLFQWGYYTEDKERKDSFTLHREDGPAMLFPSKMEYWYNHGVQHRENGPAMIDIQHEVRRWYFNGKLHRIGGPAVTVRDDEEEWWIDGVLHRDGGPARTCAEKIGWYSHGKLHRVDGPAMVRRDGSSEWCINGFGMQSIRGMLDSQYLNNDEKIILKLKYGHLLTNNNA